MDNYTELLTGYRRFREGSWQSQRARWDELAQGQAPKIMVISCSDSRVDPTRIFDVDPGRLFVVRNVAAMVPPYETTPGHHGVSAALEFAVQSLEVEEVLVMGHGLCGGCKAALSQDLKGAAHGEGGFIADWISMLDDARAEVVDKHGDSGPEAERAMERAGVRASLANLRTFPFVQEKEAAGKLALRGAYFSIADGVLHSLDETSGEFSPAE